MRLCRCRCMAISAAVFVGGIEPWKERLIEKAKSLSVGPGDASNTDVGPLISPEAKDRAARLIQSGVDQVSILFPLYTLCLPELAQCKHAMCAFQRPLCLL